MSLEIYVLSIFANNHNKLKTMYPDWRFVVHDDLDARKFIELVYIVIGVCVAFICLVPRI